MQKDYAVLSWISVDLFWMALFCVSKKIYLKEKTNWVRWRQKFDKTKDKWQRFEQNSHGSCLTVINLTTNIGSFFFCETPFSGPSKWKVLETVWSIKKLRISIFRLFHFRSLQMDYHRKMRIILRYEWSGCSKARL